MIADGDALELGLRPAGIDAYEREIGGAAADVTDQQEVYTLQGLGQPTAVGPQEVVAGCLRFFEQTDIRKARPPCRLHRQGAGRVVERCGDGDNDILRFQRMRRETVVPGTPHVPEETRRCLDRRHLGHLVRCAPRQDVGRPVDARVAQPALGAGDQPTTAATPELAGEFTDHRAAARSRFLHRPGQGGVGFGEFARRRVIAYRRQQRATGDLSRRDELFQEQRFDPRRITAIGVRDDGVRGTEVDAYDVAGHSGRHA
ncbi:hypothetical protein [Plasmodium yoelii yoelii]|uniref:Uncharacterized protein n=1 Tax=Plasmodium yoelii yoelii TaxID=73239 RepID=Q7R764_PLAYO|nr:hypothetical protein [Plasmodium yoelii yoelii]